jgi:hypothetical protein
MNNLCVHTQLFKRRSSREVMFRSRSVHGTSATPSSLKTCGSTKSTSRSSSV